MLGVGEHCFRPSICAYDVFSISSTLQPIPTSGHPLTAVSVQHQLRLAISQPHTRLMELGLRHTVYLHDSKLLHHTLFSAKQRWLISVSLQNS